MEQRYEQNGNFRGSLITGLNQTKEWQKMADDNGQTNPLGLNSNQLILDINGDRLNNKTYLLIQKNGLQVSIELTSTWGYGQQVFVYMSVDGSTESFQLYDITTESSCDTNPPTTSPSNQPSESPSEAPTATQISVYDGSSTIILDNQQTNWIRKYPLGDLCGDGNWRKTLSINMTATTSQADFVFAIGTQNQYMAATIGMIYISTIYFGVYLLIPI